MHLPAEAVAQVFSYVFAVLITTLIGAGVKYLADLSKSVGSLNEKMAIALTRIDAVSDRVTRLERAGPAA